MIWITVSWAVIVIVITLWVFAANGGRFMWLHTHWPTHRQRMARAQLCLEAAEHWQEPTAVWRFMSQAYRLCADCGCPPDCWPVGVLRIHAGVVDV